MKILSRIAAAAAVAVLPFVASSTAYAAYTCQIGYTGPNSSNLCELESTYTCTIKNDNEFEIINNNTQEATSGTATNSGNTTGGSATSGSATNQNGTTINVDIDNSGSAQLCKVVTIVPATPEEEEPAKNPPAVQPQVTPEGGRGGVAPVVKEVVQPPQKAAPAVLPTTSGNDFVNVLIATAGLLGAGAVVTRLAVATYNRSNS